MAVFKLEDPSSRDSVKRTITITQHIGRHETTIYAGKFIPEPGDKLSYTWTDADGEHTMPMPHFCLTDIEAVGWNLLRYIREARSDLFDVARGGNELAWTTLCAALEFSKTRVVRSLATWLGHHSHAIQGSLVDLALDLWASARVIEIAWEFSGKDTLGTERVIDPANPWFGKLRLPPMMDTQLDQIVIKTILGPLKQRILKLLQKQIEDQKPEKWYETYLTIFILLHHTSMCCKHGRRFTKTYGLKVRQPLSRDSLENNLPRLEHMH